MTAKYFLEHNCEPILVVEYVDPDEGFKGWLVINGLTHSLCAGGMRVQPGLTRDHMIDMAKNMSLKMRICNLPIGGAKCGIDYDPASPGKRNAMKKFMASIKPYIETTYSMGPDMNTDMDEIESIAHEIGIPSVKISIARAKGMDMPSFNQRYSILNQPAIKSWSLSKVRAGYGVAMGVLATLSYLKIPADGARVVVQGFGNLAKACILALSEAGVTISAIADAQKSYLAKPEDALPLDSLLNNDITLLPEVPEGNESVEIAEKEAIYPYECDVLVLAAVENVVTENNAADIQAKAIVPGANLAITKPGEEILFERGVVALPSFMAGCGGSLSMDGLFGPVETPTAKEVLKYIEQSMFTMTSKVLSLAEEKNITPTAAALEICATTSPAPNEPYGN